MRHVAKSEMLQNPRRTFISGASSLEPGRICMISSFSQIALPRPKPMPSASLLDARLAL
jgi:hypothetical protein